MRIVLRPRKRNIDAYDDAILEQWKVCVEMANANSEKRSNSNNIFITINTALVAVITFSLNYKNIILSLIGIVISVLWIRTLNSYAKLSKVKYDIINELESKLPTTPFTDEWYRLTKERNYIGLTKTEKVLPCIYTLIYIISILLPIFKVLISLIYPCLVG